jgi:hypothetical protein
MVRSSGEKTAGPPNGRFVLSMTLGASPRGEGRISQRFSESVNGMKEAGAARNLPPGLKLSFKKE